MFDIVLAFTVAFRTIASPLGLFLRFILFFSTKISFLIPYTLYKSALIGVSLFLNSSKSQGYTNLY